MTLDQQIAHARNEIAGLKRLIRIGRNASDYTQILKRHHADLKAKLARREQEVFFRTDGGDNDCAP